MQHDPNEMFNRPSQPGTGTGRSETDRLGANLGDTTGDRSTSAFSDASGTMGRESLGGGESALMQKTGEAKEKLHTVKEKASTLKATLADKLEAGAERLRQRSATANVSEAGQEVQGNVRKVGTKVASGMESTADWIRNADVNQVKDGVERQVRTNPGRSLLVALGLGYVLGRALRGKRGA